MSEQQSSPADYRHSEKQEKEYEKQEKDHEKDEKNWDEKWRRDPISSAGWALLLVWAGIVLLLGNLGILDRLQPLGVWNLIFLGAAVIVFGQVLIRLLVPSYRRPIMGALILAVILLAIGLGELVAANLLWPTVLILLGLSILLRGLFRQR